MTISCHRSDWQGEGRGEILRIVRHRFPAGCGWGLHCHEYAEVFWCESGSGTHLVNRREHPVAAGDVVCVRPDDAHAGRASDSGMTILNISFHPRSAAALAERHAAAWPWRLAGDAPLHVHLLPRRMERLHAWAAELGEGRPGQLALDAFLLDLVRLLADGGAAADPLPRWLRTALEELRDPVHLAGGTAALARLAGYDPAHVNRVLRRCLGRTATEIVTDLRLDRAAAELRLGDRPVAGIASLVGLANLGHFYQRFQARFGATPARYRQAARQAVSGG